MRLTLLLLPLTIALLARSSAAWAQAPDAIALRRSLIEQAQEARRREQHAEALRLAEAAGRIEMTPSLRLFITLEQFVLNRFVAAMGSADLCLREAGERAVARRGEIVASCASYIERIRPLVGHLAVEVAEPPPEVEVRVNDLPVGSLLGFAVPVDPGRVRIVARAPGRVTVERDVEVPAGATVREAVHLAPLPPPEEPPPPVLAATPVEVARPAPTPIVVQTTPPGIGARIGAGPPVLVGAAVVFSALAGGFFALREASLQGCVVGERAIVCADATLEAEARSAPTWNALTNGALAIAGVTLLGAGIWLTVNLTRATPSATRAELRPGPGSLELRLRW